MNDLESAIVFATKKHAGQTDKAGEAYINHPLRVMDSLDTRTEKIVGVLHDTVEDTDATVKELHEIFGRRVAIPVSLLTHTQSEDTDYLDYIKDIKRNEIATRVKLADLQDNMNLSRLDEISQSDLERRNKYESAHVLLTGGEKPVSR